MKRIQAACLEQTIHFQLKEDVPHDQAVKNVREEAEHYKAMLLRNRTKHKIVSETEQPDGSILIKLKKQYNYHNVGDYLD